jgi:lysophospholipase L1-like esterase
MTTFALQYDPCEVLLKRAILFSLATLLLSSGASGQARYDSLPIKPEHYQQRLAKFKAEPVVTGKTVFLGDDHWESINLKRLLKDSSVINRGISGDNTFGVSRRLDEIASRKPSTVFILVGINDLSRNVPNEVIIENIFAIISKVKSMTPNGRVFVISLLPVNPTIKDFPAAFRKQQNIIEINGQLKRYGEALKYKYVDLYSQLADGKDMLDARYTLDGLHLNDAGNARWVEYLRKEKYW